MAGTPRRCPNRPADGLGDVDAEIAAAPWWWTAATRRRRSTTARWSRTPRPRAGGRRRLEVVDSNQGAGTSRKVLAQLFDLGPDAVRVRVRTRRRRASAPRGWVRTLVMRGHGGDAVRPPGAGDADAAAGVLLVGYAPHGAAGAAGADSHGAAAGVRPRVDVVHLDDPRIRRAGRRAEQRDVRGRRDPDPYRRRTAGPADARVDARRRARRRARSRWSPRWTNSRRRAGMDPMELRLRNEPAAGPVSGKPFSSRGADGVSPGGRTAVRLGGPRSAARGAPRGRLAAGQRMAAGAYGAGASRRRRR